MNNNRTEKNPVVLGLIVARMGSKRLPGKNMRPLCGKPLIVWTIEAAKASRLLTELVCSTDDERVMDLCVDLGVDVIVRPAELATDEATSESVILHALERHPCDVVCLLQPTSPLRIAEDIDACIAAAIRAGAALTESMSNPGEPNGAVYAAETERFRRRGVNGEACRGFDGAVGLVMPWSRSVDVDTLADFEKAERLMSERREAGGGMTQKQVNMFIAAYKALCKQYGLTVNSCGCCSGPWLEKTAEPGDDTRTPLNEHIKHLREMPPR